MKQKLISLLFLLGLPFTVFAAMPTQPASAQAQPLQQFAICGDSLFGIFPTWSKYIQDSCDSEVELNNINDFWLIGLAAFEIITRLAGFIAVGFLITGGFFYMTSQGNPQKIAGAQKTILMAVIGLAVAFLSTAIVNFVGRTLG